MKKYIPFYFFVSGFFLLITIPNLFSNGMFMDGLLYATISRNLANGLGSFWHLHLSNSLYNVFYEHPPLSFWLESLFFRIFGDHLFVERLYSLVTYISTGWIMFQIWKEVIPEKEESVKTGWIPLFLWFLFPLVTWGCSNNMIENTMSFFTTLSIFFILKQINTKRFYWSVLGGFSLFCGFLTKGFVALFPWSSFFFIYLISRNMKFGKMFWYIVFVIFSTLIPLLFIFFFIPTGFESLSIYLNHQVLNSIKHVHTVSNRFYILKRLLTEMSLPLLAVISVFTVAKIKKKKSNDIGNIKWGAIFFLIGLSGVLPIMVSLKQRGFYILSTFPIFAISLGLFINCYVARGLDKISINTLGYKIFYVFSMILLIVAFVLIPFFNHKIGRNKNYIADMYKITNYVHKNSTISCAPHFANAWILYGYLGRFGNISVEPKFSNKYCLLGKSDSLPVEYKIVPLKMNNFVLLEKQ